MSTIAKPFGWLLMWLYNVAGNYGIAVILFALVVKVILLPFQMKSKRGMMRTSSLQPRLKELEKKHGANKQKYNEEVAKLYKEENINPMSGCIWTLIPFPILLALYQAIRFPITIMMGVSKALLEEGGAIAAKLSELGFESSISSAYVQISQTQFISRPENLDIFQAISEKIRAIDYTFLGMDLGAQPQWNVLWSTNWSDSSVWLPAVGLFLIPILAGVLTWFSTKITAAMNAGDTQQQSSMKSMNILMPVMTLWFGFMMPAALGLYWIASMFFGMIQDIWLTKRYTKIMAAENAVRNEKYRLKEEELEKKRLETERLKAENAADKNPNTSKKKQQIQQRQEREAKASEWEKKHTPEPDKDGRSEEPSRVEGRRYARGRAYDPERFAYGAEGAEEDEVIPDEAPAENIIADNGALTAPELQDDYEYPEDYDDYDDDMDDDQEEQE